ncbi:MAG TPA: DUF4173 domain-containing protein [Clostridiaceae bacterium]|nr:DUF4173 domain-containing protein [Clostridiaceae bacterium]
MENNLVCKNKIRDGLYCIFLSLLLGVIFDRLFFDRALGISYFLFISLCIAFSIWLMKESLHFKWNTGWFLLIPIALLSFSYTVHTNGILSFFNFLIVPLLMVVSSILIYEPGERWDKMSFIVEIIEKAVANVLCNIPKPFRITRAYARENGKSKSKGSRRQIVIGLLISLPVLFVIIGLLSSADMVFNYYLNNFASIFKEIDFERIILHAVLIFFVAFYFFGYVWGFKEKNCVEKVKSGPALVTWEPVTLITFLAILNLLYLAFSVIQFSYLYGGGSMALPAGFTYSEYARKGFFELVAVTSINFIIVFNCVKFIKRENKKLLTAGNILLSVLIFFTLNMLYSANLKLSLYESSYGYTYLRVFVHLFMLLLFVLCLVVLAGIWIRRINIVKSIIVISLVMYTVINYINIDGFIARKNVDMYFSKGKVDVYYLNDLSFEAVPYLIKLKNAADPSIRESINENLAHRKEMLESEKSWGEFNFSKYKARKLLKGI